MRITATVFALLALCSTGNAHDWYDFECCADKDCEETTKVIEIRGGYLIVETKEWIGPRDPKVRLSKDQDFHRCRMGEAKSSSTRCLYVPQPSF